MRRTALVLAATLLLTACADEAVDATADTPPVSEGLTVSESGGDPVDPPSTTAGDATGLPVPVPPSAPPIEASVGGVPDDLLTQLVAEAAGAASVGAAAVEVIRAQQVVWSDTSLGCPQPGQMYAEVLTNGYWVVLQAADDVFDYRATINGDFSRCIGGLPPVDVLVDR